MTAAGGSGFFCGPSLTLMLGDAGGPEAIAAIWLPARQVHQQRVVAAPHEPAAGVPCGRRAALAGGLRSADKTRALVADGIDRAAYLTIDVDLVLAELARRSLTPGHRPGQSPAAADLVHDEARHLAKRITTRANRVGSSCQRDEGSGFTARSHAAICLALTCDNADSRVV